MLNSNINTTRSWLIYKIVDIIRYRAMQHSSVIASGIITNVAVIISVLSAVPWIRKLVLRLTPITWYFEVLTASSNYHNTFERHHRFIGWLGIAVCTMFTQDWRLS